MQPFDALGKSVAELFGGYAESRTGKGGIVYVGFDYLA